MVRASAVGIRLPEMRRFISAIKVGIAGIAIAAIAFAQSRAIPDWEKAAGGKLAFEVASVKLASAFAPPSFPLDPGDAYADTGGRFRAFFPLQTYITFAYKLSLTPEQRSAIFSRVPDWVAMDRYAIEAKAPTPNPTKDQMRLMMQSLLAERFHLPIHFETRETSILALTLVKPGKLGPKLIHHEDGPPCDIPPPAGAVLDRCDVMALFNRDGLSTAASRNNTISYIAGALPGLGHLSRPVVDQTGLTGRFDFTLEFAREQNSASATDSDNASDPQGPSFLQALRDQLGLK